MDQKQDIIALVQRFYKEAKKNFDISRIILFGSYASNNFHQDSDIDVAVFINNDISDNCLDITSDLFDIASKIDIRIEPLCYFLDEINEAEPASILSSIIRNGIDVTIN